MKRWKISLQAVVSHCQTQPQREDIIRKHHQLGPHCEEQRLSLRVQDLLRLRLVDQVAQDFAGVEGAELDRKSLESMLGRDVVLNGELELLLAEGAACHSLNFVVRQRSREESRKDVVVVVRQLELGPVFTDERAKGSFDVLLSFVRVDGRIREGQAFIELVQFRQDALIHLLPKRAVLEVVLRARNGVIQLQVGIVLLVIVDSIDGLVVGQSLSRKVIQLYALGALPESKATRCFGHHPTVLSFADRAHADIGLQPHSQQQRAQEMAVIFYAAFLPIQDTGEAFEVLLSVMLWLGERDERAKPQRVMRRIYSPDSEQRLDHLGKRIVDLVLGLRIDWYSSGLQGSMHAFYLVPEGVRIGMELVVGGFLQLLLKIQLPVQRPFRQEQMLRQGVDRQRNRQDTSGGQSSESIMLIRRQLDIQVQ